VMLPEGGFGVVFDEPADQARLRRWAEDEFTAEDEVLAERWRSASAKLNLDASVTEARRSIKGLPKPTTLSEVSAQVDRYLETGRQYHFVCEAMERLGFGRSTRDKAMLRWRIQNHSSFRRFAPYTFIVYRTIMIYAAGLVLGLIGTRSTNCLDLEYLFYLPFSKVFCSGDQFLVEMAPVLLEPDQLFIGREMLRFDMKAISNVRKAETEVQREAVISGFSSGPNRPFSHALWNLIPRPWEQKERDLEFTEEGEKWLQNQIKQWTSTIEKASEG
ncbi:MAG: hypothetical protein HZA91_04590, partial [Verrucomicrobia bacterium]|nr:hypothetical protein [Verrucomicrobiota bacterium]